MVNTGDKISYPHNWKIRKLGDLGVFFKGKGISKSDVTDQGLPCIRYGEIYTHHHFYIKEFYSFISEETARQSSKIQKGDILFAGSGETIEEIGKSVAYLEDREAYAGGDIIIFRVKEADSKFLAFALNYGELAKKRAKLGQGHSVVHIYSKDLKELKVPLPPKPEQQKIAEILSTWDKAIELKEKLIEQKKQLKKGLMQKLLTGEVRLPGFEGEWVLTRIKNISKVYRGASPRPITDQRWFDQKSTIGWVRISDVTKSKKYLLRTEQYLSDEGVEKSRLVEKGKIIMSICATVGKPIITSLQVCIHDGFVVFDDLKVNKEFFYYLLSKLEKQWSKYGQVGSQMNLNTNIVGNEKIKIPKDILEQEKIANVLGHVDTEIELLEKELQYLKLQKKGLMQLLLTGKVRVKV